MTGRHIAYCHYCTPCGKQAYSSRDQARKVRKRIPNPADRGALNAYPCPHRPDYWHLGHLPAINDARDTLRRQRRRAAGA